MQINSLKIKKYLSRADGVNIALIALIIVSLFLHVWRLWEPNSFVFDEVYYAKYAHFLLTHEAWIDVHPPLAEGLIAITIKIFGNNSVGWRFIPAVLGVGCVPVTYFLTRNIFKNEKIGLIAAFLVTFDGLFLVQSRAALLIIFVTFFTLCAYLFTSIFAKKKQLRFVALAAISMGLALSSQWTAAPFWLILFIWTLWAAREKKPLFWAAFSTIVIVPLIVYGMSFLITLDGQNYYKYIIDWHKRSWQFHSHLKGNHLFASRWYRWLYMSQPIAYYQAKYPNGFYGSVVALGNPWIWWSSIVAALYGVYKLFVKGKTVLLIPFFSFAVYYFGWSAIGREQFLYYVLPAAPFLFILLAYVLFELHKKYKHLFTVWMVATVVIFFFFYPIYVARPISPNYFRAVQWLPSWHKINIIDKK